MTRKSVGEGDKTAMRKLHKKGEVRFPTSFSSSSKPLSLKTQRDISTSIRFYKKRFEKTRKRSTLWEEVLDIKPNVNHFPVTVAIFCDVNLEEKMKIALAACVHGFRFRDAELEVLAEAREAKNPVEEYAELIKKSKKMIRYLIFQNNCAPLMLSFAWHLTEIGRPRGALRLKPEGNGGIVNAVRLLKQIKKRFPSLSHRDLYQLAGIVALENHWRTT